MQSGQAIYEPWDRQGGMNARYHSQHQTLTQNTRKFIVVKALLCLLFEELLGTRRPCFPLAYV